MVAKSRAFLPRAAATCSIAAILAFPGLALAAPVISGSPVSFAGTNTSFGFGNLSLFTLSSTGDIFNPVAVATAGSALANSFGGFLGIPVSPTTNFIDRGTVTFGSQDSYSAFPVATTIPFSNGDNFLGISFSLQDGTHFGFVQFQDTNLVGYGYENTPGATITAIDITTVPEPMSAALISVGLAGLALVRTGRCRTSV